MRVALASDLHLEGDRLAWQPVLSAVAHTLVLAGDIIQVCDATQHEDFFSAVSSAFDNVVVVMGNHEHWHGNILYTHRRYKTFLDQYPNIHLLEKSSVELDGVRFLGCTLWGGMNRGDPLTMMHCDQIVNDRRRIKTQTGPHYHQWDSALAFHEHCASALWLEQEIPKSSLPTVVVTHHAPCELSIHEHYRTHRDYHSNGAYWSDQTHCMIDPVRVWCHGHMHSPSDYMVGGTRVLNHPRGYPGWDQSKDWEPLVFVVEP